MKRFWDWLFVIEKEPMLVNLTTLPTTKQDMVKAFAVSESMLWWRALMQNLAVKQQEQLEAADAAIHANNPLLVAGHVKAAKILNETILDLQKLREKSVSG